ncbi:MAG: hypothetical protein ACLFTK_05935 [Anaerolineales bacterium]
MAIFIASTSPKWLWGLLTLLAVAGCTSGAALPTATPPRSAEPAALHVTNDADAAWVVTLREVTPQLAEDTSPDHQMMAFVAGNAGQAYVAFPSDQPGSPQATIDLSEYPLHIPAGANTARLWVLALRNTAYPVVADQQAAIMADLAAGFAEHGPRLAHIVAQNDDLQAWFGQMTLIGEIAVSLGEGDVWLTGENTVSNAGLDAQYDLSALGTDPITSAQAATPRPPDTPTPSSTPPPSQIEGWRLVIDEDFSAPQNQVTWFTGNDNFYTASLVEGAYQIALTQLDPLRGNVALSWGSVQDLSFDTYIVRARMRILEPDVIARYGLWLHYQDDLNFLFFGVETTGRFRVARFQRTYTELTSWASSDTVNQDNAENVMEVRLIDDEYTLSINGTPMTVTQDNAFREGRIAFFCYAESVPATCQLQTLQVWVPDAQPFPRPTHTPAE